MFIKTSIFKRILKDAWKGAGLTVGKKEEMYFIQGAYWILFVYEKDFTSKNKAAVIELVGDLPEEGEVYRAYEKGEKQYELKVRDEWEYKKWLSARDRYEDTEIKYRGSGNIFKMLRNKRDELHTRSNSQNGKPIRNR